MPSLNEIPQTSLGSPSTGREDHDQSSPQAARHILAFDVYGTLLDPSSISKAVEKKLHISTEKAKEISTSWRTYQLEYTWRLNSMELYEPFDEVTRRSLIHAALDHGFDLSPTDAQDICEAYLSLSAFSDAVDALKALRAKGNVKATVFSNGTENMVSSALSSNSIDSLISDRFLTHRIKKFKPSPVVYLDLLNSLGMQAHPERVWLVSGNPFDVSGARSSGMNAIWVDRAGKGWVDRLLEPKLGGPTKIVRELKEIPEYLESIQAA